MSKIAKPALSLKHFILKQEVKNLYRKIFRAIRQVPDQGHQQELKEWARRDFRSNAHHTDEITIKMYIKYGERCLKELENTISLAK
ncbi:LYR motif-containing protein 2 [Tribolium castaneum]|uniref:LYR motif-containing protein 2 n=1 Tax=Tribolium castaneum TaxID=7070 RepID=D6WA42_TRICA|nr:PREDICTED: LYR motif-containing protein 2 [Tribolium castaneum]EEZ98583.1 LYR motif-containing protein 2-like Protein [Tribolium castaneum]|eukprot:XP_967880.1 PREDICTED: LYR motif-containing protein 2 [Tribolium castaneum]